MSLAEQFYEAFKKQDGEQMTTFYHSHIVFSDPAFGTLSGEKAGAMWQMLCSQATDLDVTYEIVKEDGDGAIVRWEATYTFSKTGRKVKNEILATLEYQDGKIIRHDDTFDLWKWARMAMGSTGLLLGWSPFFRKKLQAQTRKLLEKYLAKK